MIGRLASAYLIGWRSPRGDSAIGIHRLGVGTAACAVFLVAMAMLLVGVVAEQRQDRAESRTPVLARDVSDATSLWLESPDALGTLPVSIVFVQPLSRQAPLPPGLRAWPDAGEVVASPELQDAATAAGALDRWGQIVGKIGDEGLVDQNERLAYVGVEAESFSAVDSSALRVSRFGQAPAAQLSSVQFNREPAAVRWLILATITPGVIALIVAAARSSSVERDRRLLLLESLGASHSARAAVVVGEAMQAVLSGVLGGIILVTVATVTGLPLPGANMLTSAEARSALFLLPGIGLGSAILMLAAVVILHRPSSPLTHNRPVVTDRPARWRLLMPVAGLALAGIGTFSGGSTGYLLFLAGSILAVIGAPVAVGPLGMVLGRHIARYGNRSGRPHLLVAGRWLASRPGPAIRLGAAYVVLLAVITQMNVLLVEYTTSEREAVAAEARLDATIVQIRDDRISSDDATRLEQQLTGSTVVRIVQDAQSADAASPAPTIYIPCVGQAICAKISKLGDLPDDGQLGPLKSALFAYPPETLVRVLDGEANAGTIDELLIVTGDVPIEQVRKEAYSILPTPYVTTPTEPWIVGAAARARLASWLLTAGGLGLLALSIAGLLGAAGAFSSQAKELGGLAAFMGGLSPWLRLSFASVGVPLLLAIAVGSVALDFSRG